MKGLSRDLKKIAYTNRPIKCTKCGSTGGTLVKVDNHYEHMDKELCKIMSMRRSVKI